MARDRKRESVDGDAEAERTRNIPAEAQGEHAWERDEQVQVPEHLGRYTIVGRLGQGAMGTVYEAMDPGSRSTVAIKTITRMSPEGLRRFKREFRSLARFQHRNVVSLYELVQEGDQLFYTMELVPGQGFVRWACGDPRPDTTNAFSPCRDYERLQGALQQLAAGVHAIHEAGYLHRDIKPSNLLVTPEGRVVILDFGLVREHRLEVSERLTDDGMMLGTPLYMSPEQAEGETLDPASDWYAVGAVLYQALVGTAPFQGKGILGLLESKGSAPPPAPASLVPTVPPALDELCMELLSVRTEDRPSGASIVARLGAIATTAFVAPQASPGQVFLGRERQLQALRDALAERAAGRPVVALVDGVSGMGKSALVQEFLAEVARRPGSVVLGGKCSERESIPYKALDGVMDALGDFLRTLPSDVEVRALLPRDAHAVARLFPALMAVPAIARAPAREQAGTQDPNEARLRAFASLRELMGRIADERRVVVHIDDMQWSDLDSAVLVDALLRHPDAPGLLLVVTFREGADAAEGSLARLVQSLQTEGSQVALRRVHVGALAPDEATELAERLLGDELPSPRAVAEQIAREAEGSPFFIGELARYARGAEEQSQPGAPAPVVELDTVIRHRLSRLPPLARALLEVIAVAGGRAPQAVARRAAIPEGDDRTALAVLRAQHLVRTDGPGEHDAVEIHHDRIRQAVQREIEPARLPVLHLQLATELEATGQADAAALSHHYRQAGEAELATRYTIAAADQAADSLAFDRAAELYRIAIELDAMPQAEVLQTEAKRGEALANAGRLHEAAAAYLQASEQGQDREHLQWTMLAASHLLGSGHTEEGRAALDTVLGTLGITLPRSDARAIVSIIKHRLALGLRGLRYRLRHAADVAPQQVERVDACWTVARGLLFTDGIVAADFHARGLRYALASGDPVRICRALAFEGQMLTAIGADKKLDRALALVEEAARLAEKTDSDYARGIVEFFRGHVWIGVGAWHETLQSLEKAAAIFRERCTGVSQEVAVCGAHSAICLMFLGRFNALRTRVRRLLDEALERSNPYVEGFARGVLINVLLADDRADAALDQLRIYQRDAPKRFQPHRMNYVAQDAALRRYTGDTAGAWAVAEEQGPALEKLALFQAPQAWSELRFWQGICALAAATEAAEPEPLLRHATAAAAKLRKHPSVFGRGYGELVAAGAPSLHGQQDDAVAALRRALELFQSRKMAAYVAAARMRLGALLGGDEGAEHTRLAEAYYAEQGVVAPERFVAMTAPGFVRAVS